MVLDANLSQACLIEIFSSLDTHYENRVPLFALAVSPLKAVRYLPKAEQIDVLFCNRREAAALTQLDWQTDLKLLADALLKLKFNSFVITDGGNPMLVQEQQLRTSIAIPPVHISKNVNGAGDALAGATIASLILGQTLAQAAQNTGLSAARMVLNGESEPPLV